MAIKYIRYRVLDKILKHIKNSTEEPPIMYPLIFDPALTKILSNRNRKIIVEKLIRDKVIGETDFMLGDQKEKGYYITFEGLLLLDGNGYVGQRRREIISTILQSVQTWAIVIGTLGLLIFEWWKYNHEYPYK